MLIVRRTADQVEILAVAISSPESLSTSISSVTESMSCNICLDSAMTASDAQYIYCGHTGQDSQDVPIDGTPNLNSDTHNTTPKINSANIVPVQGL